MELKTAAYLAHRLREAMRPFCERIEVAGSIRRQKLDPNDIELVLIPKRGVKAVIPRIRPVSLFDEFDDPSVVDIKNDPCNLLYEQWAATDRADFVLEWIKTGTPDTIPWKVNPDGKYWRARIKPSWLEYIFGKAELMDAANRGGVVLALDIFLVDHDGWGIQYLIRTGDAEFSRAVVTHAKAIGKPCAGGHLHVGDPSGPIIPTHEETDVFRALGLKWVEPEDRQGGAVVLRASEQDARMLNSMRKPERPMRSLFE